MDPTRSLVKYFMDSAHPENLPEQRFMVGAYMDQLDTASKAFEKKRTDLFGFDTPESIAYQFYNFSGPEAWEREHAIKRIENAYAMGQWTHPEIPIDTNTRFIGIQSMVQSIRLKCLEEEVLKTSEPDLSLHEPIEQVPAVQMPFTGLLGSRNRTGNDCVTCVYGMNIAHFLQDAALPIPEAWPPINEWFDGRTANEVIRDHRHAPATGRYDLAWQMQTLGSPDIQELAGTNIRSVVTIGADLGDIEAKIIKPLRRKAPDVRVVINTLIGSDTILGANHAVTILAADGEIVTVQDPKYGVTKDMKAGTFWERWVATNMQAVIVLAA